LSFGVATIGVATKLSWLQFGNSTHKGCTAWTITGLATMAAAKMLFRLQLGNMTHECRKALTIIGIVTYIAFYHYVLIIKSWVGTFSSVGDRNGGYSASLTGATFKGDYCYVNCFLPVTLLRIVLSP